MHTELLGILNTADQKVEIANLAVLRNAERVLKYIDDLHLERNGKFEYTPAESFYLLWEIEEWELHIECLKSGNILYTFRRYGMGKASGKATIDEFIALLERYLLTVVFLY